MLHTFPFNLCYAFEPNKLKSGFPSKRPYSEAEDQLFVERWFAVCTTCTKELTYCLKHVRRLINSRYSQTCVQRPPLGPQKSVHCSKVKTKWSLFTVCSYKIAISFVKLGLKLAIVDRWSLFRGGRKHRFD